MCTWWPSWKSWFLGHINGLGLLGIRPIQLELDLRMLKRLGNVLLHKDTLIFEIAQRQLAVKFIGSNSWFADCNRLLYKYNLPNIYHVIRHIESPEGWGPFQEAY